MMMNTRFPSIFALLLLYLSSGAGAQTLQLPENLVNLNSDKGAKLLIESEALEAYWPLSIQFVTQKNQAFCGVASIVMVLNALGVPAPSTPEFEPFNTFTQDNVFNPKTDTVITQELLARQGMTLDQIGQFLSTYPIRAEVHHAADSTLESFRSAAREFLATDNRHVIVNYLRRTIGQEKGGHISPLAAYDADTDRFLILDVSRYKYPPVWVSAKELFEAMNTTDSDNADRTRGFVLVSVQH
jgi:glutathione-S-conjugate glycine hydrolase